MVAIGLHNTPAPPYLTAMRKDLFQSLHVDLRHLGSERARTKSGMGLG